MLKLKIALSIPFLILAGSHSWSQDTTQRKPEPVKGGPSSTTVYSVLVDVIVTDKNGRHVNDLRPEEFEVYENGVKQKIDSVELQTADVAQVIKTPAGNVPPAAMPAARRTNIITFLMDYSTTDFANQKFVRDGAIRYINEKVGPNDLVAVFSINTGGLRALQPFISDKKLLAASLGKGDVSGSAHKGEREQLNAVIGGENQLGLEPTTQSSGSGFVPTEAATGAASGSARGRAMIAQRIENSFIVLRSFTDSLVTRPVLAAIKAIATAEKDIPGRKTLVLFSEGFVITPTLEDTMRDAVDTANKANLAIYAVNTKGLTEKAVSNRGELESINANLGRTRVGSSAGESLFDRARQVGSDQDESPLRFIASSTGGFLIRNTNDFEVGLLRIDDDIRSYYLLSYHPPGLVFDGKFHEIRVEVTRPGLKVRARNGYFANPPGDSLLPPDQRALFSAAREKKSAAPLPILVTAGSFFPGATAPAAVVTVEVPTDSLKFKEIGNSFDDSLQIIGLVRDQNGGPISTFGRPLPLAFNKVQLEAVRGGYITHSETVILDPGKYVIEVVVSEPSSGNYGYYFQELSLSPPADFRLSDLVLSRQVVKAIPEAKADPLVTGDAKILPSASRQFRNGERLIFYFDIYNAAVRDLKSNVEVTLSMTRDGKPLAVKLPVYKISEPSKAETFRIQVAKYLELASLPVGNYALIVRAKDQNGGKLDSAESSFSIVN
jgi:VWFA-related protein